MSKNSASRSKWDTQVFIPSARRQKLQFTQLVTPDGPVWIQARKASLGIEVFQVRNHFRREDSLCLIPEICHDRTHVLACTVGFRRLPEEIADNSERRAVERTTRISNLDNAPCVLQLTKNKKIGCSIRTKNSPKRFCACNTRLQQFLWQNQG